MKHAFSQTQQHSTVTPSCEIPNNIDLYIESQVPHVMYRNYIKHIALAHEKSGVLGRGLPQGHSTIQTLGSDCASTSDSRDMAESADKTPTCTAADTGGPVGSEGGSDKEQRVRRSHKSAVCIIPPEEVWEQIQDIRR